MTTDTDRTEAQRSRRGYGMYAVALELLGHILASTPYRLDDAFRGRVLQRIVEGLEEGNCRIIVSDGRFLALPKESTFLDLSSKTEAAILPTNPIISVAMDGDELLRRRTKEQASD